MFDAELYRDQKRLTNGKEIPFRHSKLPVKAKWITTDEIIAFEQKIEANPIGGRFCGKLRLDIAELTKFTYSENKMQ
jgi:hypothetical protein